MFGVLTDLDAQHLHAHIVAPSGPVRKGAPVTLGRSAIASGDYDRTVTISAADGHAVAVRRDRSVLVDATADETALRRFLGGLPGVDPVGVEQRAASLATRSIKKQSKVCGRSSWRSG